MSAKACSPPLAGGARGGVARPLQSAFDPCPSRLGREAVWALALLLPLALTRCGTPTACLANRYDGYAPQYRCISGVQLPYDILKDTDPNSGSTAPVTVAQ